MIEIKIDGSTNPPVTQFNVICPNCDTEWEMEQLKNIVNAIESFFDQPAEGAE